MARDRMHDFDNYGYRNNGQNRYPTPSGQSGYGSAVLAVILLVILVGSGFVLASLPNSAPAGSYASMSTVLTEPDVTEPAQTEPLDTLPPDVTKPRPSDDTQDQPEGEFTLRYYGKQLPGKMGDFYLELAKNVAECADVFTCRIPFSDAADKDTLRQKLSDASIAVADDYCELFWYNGASTYTYTPNEEAGYWQVEFTPVYRIETVGIEEKKAFVENAVRDFIEEHRNLSDWEKALAVYEFLIDNTIYDHAYLGTTIYDFFSTGRGVCEGYARSASYILNRMGVETIYVSGMGTNSAGITESHAWNIVKINGVYCQMDATWGDPVNDDGSQTKNFKYFLLSDEQMYRNHQPDHPELLPACTDVYEYYRVHDLLMASYDEQRMMNMIAQQNGRDNTITFRVTSEAVYRQILKACFENEGFWTLYTKATGGNGATRYTWWDDDAQWVITVAW